MTRNNSIVGPLNRRQFAVLAAGAAASLAVAVVARPALAQAVRGTVFTADERGNSITAIDLVSGRATIHRVPISAHNVQVTADGRWLLATGSAVAGHGGHDEAEGSSKGRLLVFDAGNLNRGPIANIEMGHHPAHVIAGRDGRRAFVTNGEDANVSVVDLVRRKVERVVAVGSAPHGMRMSPDEREIYVANVGDGTVSVVDAARLVEVARVPVGPAPVQVGFTPDGRRLFVSLRDANAVAVVDVAARRALTTIPVGRGPIQVYATPDGRWVYVANEGTQAQPERTVSVIDVAESRVAATIETGAGAHGVVVTPDGSRAFVSNIWDDNVAEVDTTTHTVVRRIAVGRGPNGITYRGVTR